MSDGAASTPPPTAELSREAIARVDRSGQLDDVLGTPEHLRDALWRVESAIMQDWDTSAGLVVAGMGGSAVGGARARGSPPTRRVRSSSRAPAPSPLGRRPTRWFCARATRATPRRRSPATS